MQWKLKKLRKEKNLKQSDVADFVGISLACYRARENGNVEFDAVEMYKVSVMLQQPITGIFLPACIDYTDIEINIIGITEVSAMRGDEFEKR